jgi:tRNA pseudouridine55 synthase
MMEENENGYGLFLVNKAKACTSFSVVRSLRRRLNIKKIGHAGTLDPFATGVMVALIGRPYTRLSDTFLNEDKEYLAQVHLGVSTDTFDVDGTITAYSEKCPLMREIEEVISHFQGTIQQTPPMFSAKKIGGKKLYEIARLGKTVHREPVTISLKTTIIEYHYPYLMLRVNCSKGTYIRSIAEELGAMLGCGAHLSALERTRSGSFHIEDCIASDVIEDPSFDIYAHIRKQDEVVNTTRELSGV